MLRVDLSHRLYFQPPCAAVVRAVGYDGKTDADMRPLIQRLVEEHGDQKVSAALSELTVSEHATNRTVLRPEVRQLCWGLLGPPPEHPRHDEILFAPPLYSDEERRRWREEFEQQKAAAQEAAPSEPAKKRRRPRGQSRQP